MSGLVSGLVHGKRVGKSPISRSRFPANRESGIASSVSPFFGGGFPIPGFRLQIGRDPDRETGRLPIYRDRESGSRGRRAGFFLVWWGLVSSGPALRPGRPFAGFIVVCHTIQRPRKLSWVLGSGYVDHAASAQLHCPTSITLAAESTPQHPSWRGYGRPAKPHSRPGRPGTEMRPSRRSQRRPLYGETARKPSSGPNMTAGHHQVEAARRLRRLLRSSGRSDWLRGDRLRMGVGS